MSVSGVDMTVDISGGWYGSGGLSFPLVYTTTAVTSSSNTITCTTQAPPSGFAYQFYWWIDGSETANLYSDNAHLWYDATIACNNCS